MCTTVPSAGSGASPIARRRCCSLFAPESHGGPWFCAPGRDAIVSKLGPIATRDAAGFDDELEPQPATASAMRTTRARRTVGTVAPRPTQASNRRRLADAAGPRRPAGGVQHLERRGGPAELHGLLVS